MNIPPQPRQSPFHTDHTSSAHTQEDSRVSRSYTRLSHTKRTFRFQGNPGIADTLSNRLDVLLRNDTRRAYTDDDFSSSCFAQTRTTYTDLPVIKQFSNLVIPFRWGYIESLCKKKSQRLDYSLDEEHLTIYDMIA